LYERKCDMVNGEVSVSGVHAKVVREKGA